MGEVWKAWDTKGDRFVALKFLPQELSGNDDEIARIRDTFKLVEQLDHPHICRVFDLNEHPQWGWYQVMRWIDGETLAQYRRETVGSDKQLSLDEVIDWLRPVAEALDYAHGRNVLHRDVKPQNIMCDAAGQARLNRLWPGCRSDTSLTRIHLTLPMWQERDRISHPSNGREPPVQPQDGINIAPGVTAYELLGGRRPYEADDADVLARLWRGGDGDVRAATRTG